MAKKDAKSKYAHYELGIYKGITFKLVVPSIFNTDKYPNYYIQYDGSKKYYVSVKDIYREYLNYSKQLQTLENLIELFLPIINGIIIPAIKEPTSIEKGLKLISSVSTAINKYFNEQIRRKRHTSGILLKTPIPSNQYCKSWSISWGL